MCLNLVINDLKFSSKPQLHLHQPNRWQLEIQSFLLQVLFQRKTLFPIVFTCFSLVTGKLTDLFGSNSSCSQATTWVLRMSHPLPPIPPSPANCAPSSLIINLTNVRYSSNSPERIFSIFLFLNKMITNTNGNVNED